MSDFKRVIAGIGCKDGKAVLLHENGQDAERCLKEFAHYCNNNGADELLIHDFSETDEDHERTIKAIKEIVREIDIPVITGGRVKRLEDVKKYLYAGAKAVYLDAGDEDNIDLIKEASSRFGSEKTFVWLAGAEQLGRVQEFEQLGASAVILDVKRDFHVLDSEAFQQEMIPVFLVSDSDAPDVLETCMKAECTAGLILTVPEQEEDSYMEMKQLLAEFGVCVDILQSTVSWNQFKLGPNDLIPVVVQDFKTSEVLMLAYMNEQAFTDTLRTGKMHYYSRSRKSQWLKGETSGHFQYVKSLHLDCDNDTLLAKVHQIGAACHTGSRSCFYQTLAQKEYKETNPLKVFEEVFSVILDRKEHPNEGSYTNYLFDKGIDKILKKVGEEATEIVIAAKNPDPEEIKYEISDFLYHVMVLMAEKGVTWEEITEELANR